MKKEIWKPIRDYENHYEVSNFSRIRSLKYGKKRILKDCLSSCGYKIVGLLKNKERKNKMIHRIVAETFLKNENNLPTVNHKNGIKTDNRIENLEWMSYSNQQKHSAENGFIKIKRDKKTGRFLSKF